VKLSLHESLYINAYNLDFALIKNEDCIMISIICVEIEIEDYRKKASKKETEKYLCP